MTIAASRSPPPFTSRATESITRNWPAATGRSNARQVFGAPGSNNASAPDETGNWSGNIRISILLAPNVSPYLSRRATSRGAGISSRKGGGGGEGGPAGATVVVRVLFGGLGGRAVAAGRARFVFVGL